MNLSKEKTWLFIFLFALFFISCAAKKIIWPIRYVKGTVHDGKGRPLSAVTITTIPPSQTVVSDQKGNFILNPNLDGNYVLKAEKAGYHSKPVGIRVSGPVIIWSDGSIEPLKVDILMLPENTPYPKEKVFSPPPEAEEKTEADEEIIIIPGFGFLEEKEQEKKFFKSNKTFWSR
jgi:hypothetical protein